MVALAGPERYVIGLDVSENAINKAIQVMRTMQLFIKNVH